MKLFFEKQSLAKRTLVGMALRILAIIIIATTASYWLVYTKLKTSSVENLKNYVDLRSRAESEQFLLAEKQSAMLRDEFLRRLSSMGEYDPKTEFDAIFERESDGLIRVRSEINDHRHHATAYLRHDVTLTQDLRRRFYIGWQLMDQWGPLLVNNFFSGFMNMPEQLSINFCPSADWGRSATRETDIRIYETVWRSTVEKNPKRLPFWTSVYYDPGANAWMISRVTPGDYKGRWVVSGGQDVEIADLIRRTTSDRIMQGSWNFIVDAQSNLIAHPNLTEKINTSGGNLQTSKLGDEKLTTMVNAVLASDKKEPHTFELPGLDVFLGVSQIKGPGWFFVTVYPKKQLTQQALSSASVILAVGFATLLLELIIMASILKRRVSEPIARTVSATEQISHGNFNVRLNPEQNDELGQLALSVNRMAEIIGERDAALSKQFNELQEAKNFQLEQQKFESIAMLASGIAHDFNNILGAIIGYTEIALNNRNNESKWHNALNQVLLASERAAKLVKQILTFGRRELLQEKVPTQLSQIVNEALKLIRASIPATIAIRAEIISDAAVLADPSQLHQIVMNLCTNAYQAMKCGGVLGITLQETDSERAALETGQSMPDEMYAKLTVSDTGCGMDRETLAKIFNPYFTTKEIGRGTGLGLAVTHSIVESHSGLITVSSEPGKGSAFTVYLPILRDYKPSDSTKSNEPGSPLTGSKRIMVVEDEPLLEDVISECLTDAGYLVDSFSNGLHAWKALSQSSDQWDLLFTDQAMPEMTGEQLAMRALEIRPDMPVIIYSGNCSDLNGSQLINDALITLLQKPVDRATLLHQVSLALLAKEGAVLPQEKQEVDQRGGRH